MGRTSRLAAMGALLVSACRSDRPDILLVSIDTLRRDALRAFSPQAPPRPHLDALADRSVRMTSAVSTASWTLPAHASMLTGLLPHRHGAISPRHRLAAGAITLAELLGRAGYETVAFTDAGYVSAQFGLARGFLR
jgi:arylsulfatase A-like enzyme